VVIAAVSSIALGCGSDGSSATNAGQPCQGSGCNLTDASVDVPGADVVPSADAPLIMDTSGNCPPAQQCGQACCAQGEYCAKGLACAVDQGLCTTSDQCGFDSYCEAGMCVPFGVPAEHDHDESCKLKLDIEAILPSVQCRWTGPPEGDAFPAYFQVMSTPVVVDFDLDGDAKTLRPSIVFTTFPTAGSYGNPGVLRVIDGATCAQQFSIDGAEDRTMSPASAAVADLDGDGRAEIIAAAHGGGLLAFKYDPVAKQFVRLWRSGTCSGGNSTPDATGGGDKWNGPSIHDLDDDGTPEVLYGAVVYGADGCIKSSTLGFPAYSKGVVSVVADVDEDGKMELVLGNALYEWDATAGDWVAEPYFQGGSLSAGQVAVADLGNFPVAALGGKDLAEVVVIAAGTARVQTLDGTVVFGPVSIPGGGTGGAPTIADFDGDGRREFATAGGSNYVVFDLDCWVGGNAAGCGGQDKTDGVLWAQPSKDQSSNVTGSSVFDFDANGSAEAVYADECFLRIYEGATGKVLYSAARSSGTTYENPVIVDVDGDYRTEIVSAVNNYAGDLGCPSADPLLPASAFEQNHGIVVLRDEQDRWAASRPIWNQHAYAVTNVGDRGEIPKTSLTKLNWKEPGLNNFRQNVQGDLDALGVPDLTAGGQVGVVQCKGTVATIEGRVCNRGTLPMVSGTEVSFYEAGDDGAAQGALLCTAPIPIALQVGECMVVSCEADIGNAVIDVYVQVDPQSLSEECYEQNNFALYKNVGCGKQPR
jgi:hypothetical protein